MIIEKKKLSELKPAPYNPRKSNKAQEEHLKNSLTKFGLVEPIIYNDVTGCIVGGHFRVRELKKLGYKEVDCVIVSLSEEDEKELNIRLNANTGDWNWEVLAENFETIEVEEWGLEISGISDEKIPVEKIDNQNKIKIELSDEELGEWLRKKDSEQIYDDKKLFLKLLYG